MERLSAPKARYLEASFKLSGIFLSLGSNVGDCKANLKRALYELEENGIRVLRKSSFYKTEPVDLRDQPDFLNLVCEVETPLEPEELLERCLAIEKEMGRARTGAKGPRNIDIDLLFYGQTQIRTEHLTLPHPALYRRNFVLTPLEEIAPEFRDPVTGKPIKHLRRECSDPAKVEREQD